MMDIDGIGSHPFVQLPSCRQFHDLGLSIAVGLDLCRGRRPAVELILKGSDLVAGEVKRACPVLRNAALLA